MTGTEKPKDNPFAPIFSSQACDAKTARATVLSGAQVAGSCDQDIIARMKSELGIEQELPRVPGDGIPDFRNVGEQILLVVAVPGANLEYILYTYQGSGDTIDASIEVVGKVG